jgi:hypothetical protein
VDTPSLSCLCSPPSPPLYPSFHSSYSPSSISLSSRFSSLSSTSSSTTSTSSSLPLSFSVDKHLSPCPSSLSSSSSPSPPSPPLFSTLCPPWPYSITFTNDDSSTFTDSWHHEDVLRISKQWNSDQQQYEMCGFQYCFTSDPTIDVEPQEPWVQELMKEQDEYIQEQVKKCEKGKKKKRSKKSKYNA